MSVPSLAGLGLEQQALAGRRWEVLRPHVQDGVPLTQAARQAQVPLRTAQRWPVRYRAGGLAALARPKRSDRGVRRMPPKLVRLVEGPVLRRPRPSVATVARQAALAATEHGWPAPAHDPASTYRKHRRSGSTASQVPARLSACSRSACRRTGSTISLTIGYGPSDRRGFLYAEVTPRGGSGTEVVSDQLGNLIAQTIVGERSGGRPRSRPAA